MITNTAAQQAALMTEDYLSSAVNAINAKLGRNYAASHPELIAAFMRAASTQYLANIIDVVGATLIDELISLNPANEEDTGTL